jgi:hypothetical protein
MERITSFICYSAIHDNPESQRLWVGISITKKLSRVDCYKQTTPLEEISIQSICPISTIQVFRCIAMWFLLSDYLLGYDHI